MIPWVHYLRPHMLSLSIGTSNFNKFNFQNIVMKTSNDSSTITSSSESDVGVKIVDNSVVSNN